MIMLKEVALPIAIVLMLSLGQFGFKLVGNRFSDGFSTSSLLSALPLLCLVLFIYGLATVLWIYVLSYAKLSNTFVFYALSFCSIVTQSNYWGELKLICRCLMTGNPLVVTKKAVFEAKLLNSIAQLLSCSVAQPRVCHHCIVSS